MSYGSAFRFSSLPAIILAGLIAALVGITYGDIIKNGITVWTLGYPLTDKVTLNDAENQSSVAVAVNNDGQITLFISSYEPDAGHAAVAIESVNLIGADRGYVRPQLKTLDVNADNMLDLVLILNGEVFTYVQQDSKTFIYSVEASGAAVDALR